MTPETLKQLRALAEHKRLKDMAELTRANARTAATAAQLASLSNEVRLNLKDAPPEDLAIISRWLGWADQEKTRLAKIKHLQAVEAEQARGFAAISDAKARVIDDMVKKAEHQALLYARRRAEQDGCAPDK